MTATSTFRGSLRWLTPELFNVEEIDGVEHSLQPSMESDIYSLAILWWEVWSRQCSREMSMSIDLWTQILTGLRPFHTIQNDFAVMAKVWQGGRPARLDIFQTGDLSSLWEVLERGWHSQPQERPTASELVEEARSRLRRARSAGMTL
jgi:serine/threonine protein kinase